MTFVEEKRFDQIELPAKIYKYRNWTNTNHKRLLTDNEIYFSPPHDIDEQHECNLDTDYEAIKEEDLFKYAYINAEQFGIMPEDRKIEFAEWTVSNTPFHDLTHRVATEERFKQSLNNQVSIFLRQ